MKRCAPGSYRDGPYRIERGWADAPGTDRRRQMWVLTIVDDEGVADILSEHVTLRDATDEARRHARMAL